MYILEKLSVFADKVDDVNNFMELLDKVGF
jgi:hypothetical protein